MCCVSSLLACASHPVPERCRHLPFSASRLKPREKKKTQTLNFCFYQNSRFNLVLTGPFLLSPSQRSQPGGVSPHHPASPPGPGLKSQRCRRRWAATTGLLLPLVSERPQKPCGTTGTSERAWVWSGAREGLQVSAHGPSLSCFHSLLLFLKTKRCTCTPGARGKKMIGMKAFIRP